MKLIYGSEFPKHYLKWLFDSPFFQIGLKTLLKTLPPESIEVERAKGKIRVLGIVEDKRGKQIIARLEEPEASNLTVLTTIATMQILS